MSYLGFGAGQLTPPTSPIEVQTQSQAVRALPAAWYTSQEMYSLERRAIFSRKWLLTTHKLRFKKPGGKYLGIGTVIDLARD